MFVWLVENKPIFFLLYNVNIWEKLGCFQSVWSVEKANKSIDFAPSNLLIKIISWSKDKNLLRNGIFCLEIRSKNIQIHKQLSKERPLAAWNWVEIRKCWLVLKKPRVFLKWTSSEYDNRPTSVAGWRSIPMTLNSSICLKGL